ncbi:Os10g0331733 [Oryza sativa Japonica Group]|uniref:Os10g0331733 protein n=1 Tax=Oryza sativa subsp. japonica TaxID=39947 RepID=Q339U3_ORYSJ|nr:hypothetical protein LOC_Os10g18500 [Oryza sativa Japonica Group]BAT10367.1 Os10g0331733 [Oryza sativa Japonica Group]
MRTVNFFQVSWWRLSTCDSYTSGGGGGVRCPGRRRRLVEVSALGDSVADRHGGVGRGGQHDRLGGEWPDQGVGVGEEEEGGDADKERGRRRVPPHGGRAAALPGQRRVASRRVTSSHRTLVASELLGAAAPGMAVVGRAGERGLAVDDDLGPARGRREVGDDH